MSIGLYVVSNQTYLFENIQKILFIKESPPAWTQEAYRPLCSEYCFCCPNWVPPVLTWCGGDTLLGGVPYLGTPWQGTPDRVPPCPDLAWGGTLPGYPPWQGTPSRVPPILTWLGTPPGVCPMEFWVMLQSIVGYGYPPSWTWPGTPPAPWHSG